MTHERMLPFTRLDSTKRRYKAQLTLSEID